MMDVTGIEICLACLSAMKDILETIKLSEYQTLRTLSRRSNKIFRRLSSRRR